MNSWIARFALVPAALVAFGVYVGCLLWTIVLSFTSSRLLPSYRWVGFKQYLELMDSSRWNTSVHNIIIFGFWYIGLCLVIGYVLAVLIDQKVRGEALLRTIYLSPHAMSLIVTGLVWAWFLNPNMGLQAFVRGPGWESFSFAWLASPKLAIYAVVIAAVWRGAGLVMILMLAGLRGVDQEMLKSLAGRRRSQVARLRTGDPADPGAHDHHQCRAAHRGGDQQLRPDRRHDPRWSRNCHRGARQVRHGAFLRPRRCRRRHRRRRRHARRR